MSSSNLPSITVDTFTKIVEMQFKEGNFRPIFGLGKGGIGKTESIMELAKEKLKIGYIDIRLLLYSETDLKGIPYPSVDHKRTIWLQNDILPTAERDGETGILVFDEITSCSRSVRTAAYQLLNERRLGEYVLPDGWMIVCLGNGEEDGGDYQGMEGNFVNRCSVFNVVPDVEAWKVWAHNHNVNPLVTGYVSWKPADLHSYNPDSETEIAFASPRSWTAVSNILNANEFSVDDTVMCSRIQSNLGTRVGQQFIAFCKFKDKTVDPNRIICNGEKPVIEQQEVLYITISSVVKIVGDQIMRDIKASGGVQQTTINALANALNWILGLRKEYAVMGFKDLVGYEPNTMRAVILTPQLFAACPLITKFAQENESIFK